MRERDDVPEPAAWTRVAGIASGTLDLLHARRRREHYAPHVHEEFAVGVCTEGAEVIRYRGREHHSTPGTLVVLEPGEPHTGGPSVATGFAYRAMYPRPELLAEAAQGAGAVGRQPRFRDPVIPDAELARELLVVHAVLSEGTDPLEAESRLTWLLAAIVGRHGSPAGRTVGGARGAGPVARAVMARLGDQMVSPPSLAEIAADLALSRYQVLRCFRGEVGMPPYAWLAQHRVARARVLLEAGGRAADVAAVVGFADQAHLTRWFRRVVGVTPASYRNSVQDGVRRLL